MASGKLAHKAIIVNQVAKTFKIATHKREASLLRALIEAYREPLSLSLQILNKEFHLSAQEIADRVFNGEVSRQAVHKNYLGGTK